MSILKVTDIKKTFGKGEGTVQALNGVSLEIEEGKITAIMGKSGSGKSTLLNIFGGLLNMDSGEYYFRGKQQNFSKIGNLVKFRRDFVGFVVQYFALIDDLTVYENVALPLRYQKCPRRERKEKVEKVLKEMGLLEKKKAYPDELSGGQQQRVAIARALVKNPEVILADEPTGALDKKTGQEVMNVFLKLREEGKTIVIVTHDEKIAQQCDRVIYMEDGKICD